MAEWDKVRKKSHTMDSDGNVYSLREESMSGGDEYDESLQTSSSCNTSLLQKKRRGRFSYYGQNSDVSHNVKENKKGFFKVFKWFNKSKGSKSSSDLSNISVTEESTSSLNTSMGDDVFVPLTRSRSNDDNKKSSKNHGKKSRFRSSSIVRGEEKNVTTDECSSSLKSQKKRNAPQPPNLIEEVPMRGIKENRKSENRLTPLDPSNPFYSNRSSLDPSNPFYSNCSNSSTVTNSKDNDSSHRINEQELYSRMKRKAPVPPSLTESSKTQISSDILRANGNSYSNTELNDLSHSSTIRSSSSINNSTLRGSISSKCSLDSFRIDKDVFRKELPSNCSTLSKSESCGSSPNPRQWYKRKRKFKSKKESRGKIEANEEVYEFWRPELQFNDGKIISSSDNRDNIDNKQAPVKTLREKVVEACKPKRKSQISLLANISQLDEEAKDKLQLEKKQQRGRKRQNQ